MTSRTTSELSDGFSEKESQLKYEESTVKSIELPGTTVQEKRKISGRSLSLPSVEVIDTTPGWPLLRTTTLATPMVHHHTRKISVVNWVMSLPERFPHHPNLTSQPGFCDKQLKDILKEINRWFSYDVLKTATSDFTSGTNKLLCFIVLTATLSDSFFDYRESNWKRRM